MTEFVWLALGVWIGWLARRSYDETGRARRVAPIRKRLAVLRAATPSEQTRARWN